MIVFHMWCSGHENITEMLIRNGIRNGANLNVKDNRENPPLFYAVQMGKLHFIIGCSFTVSPFSRLFFISIFYKIAHWLKFYELHVHDASK